MKIADYGKAITSYIESPTTAQKLQAKEKAQTLGRTFLAEGSEDIVEPPKSMQVDTTTKGPDLFTLDKFKDKAEIYILALNNRAMPLKDIKSALNKFTKQGLNDGTFTVDEAIKVVQNLKFEVQDRAQKQRLRDNIIAGTGTLSREDFAGGTKLMDEYLGAQKEYQKAVDNGFQGTYEEFLRYKSSGSFADGGRANQREDFDIGGVAKVKEYVQSLPKNTVVTRKLIKDFIDVNDVNVNFDNLFAKNRPSYVGNFIKDKSITVDPSYAASVGDTKRFKKAKNIINNPKKLKEFLKYGNQKGVSIKDIRKKYNIGLEEFYEGGLRELFDKDFQVQAVSKLKNKTINNINILLNDTEASSFLKKGEVVPDNVLARLKLNPSAAATATVRIGQIYGGNNFGVDDFKKIRKNVKASDKLFNNMNKFSFGNPYRSKLYKASLELIDEQLGNEKGTFESLKSRARQILKKNKIKGFDINEITGVTGTAKTGAGEFSQFIDVLDSNLNQKQGAAFQSAFSNARQKIAANPAIFETEAKKINKLASRFESEYGFRLPRIRKLEEVEKFYSPKRLSDLTKQGIDIKKASEKLGYTIQLPKGAVTVQEFVKKPGLKEKFLKGIGTGAKALGKVLKPVGYAIGTAAAYQAKTMADEMGIELKPQDYFMAVDSGDPEVAIDNYKRRNVPGYSEEQAGITLGKFKDDFEEVGQTTFGKYNDQIKNIKLP
jgi:hypothetical protein